MKTKLRIINLLDKNKRGIHIRELARKVNTSYNNTVRNIKILEGENIIIKEKDANLIKIKLKNKPLTIAYLKQTNTNNFLNLPEKISDAINQFLNELNEKPLIVLIFGSYAKGNFTKNSDIDILLIFQTLPNSKTIENTAKRINMRTNTKISPVYVSYKEFEKSFLNNDHEFSGEIRKDVIILNGLEYYYNLLWRFMR